MMDSYAYLHLAVASESPSEFQFKATVPINWKQFSSLAYPYLLSLAILTTAVALPQPAIAQVFREGDRGTQVSSIQQRLQSFGYFNANVTGYYGPITRDAVIRFQQDRGISVDGVVGPNTLGALGLSFNPDPDPPLPRGVIGLGQGDQGPGVRDLQNRLRALGYFNAESTGFFGSITRNAVTNFQRALGIPATGLVSEETLVFLNNRVAVLPENPILPPSSQILQQGDTGAAVGVVQQQLAQLGFYNGAVTNYFDARTEQAVINFQLAYGIQPTGQVGATTEGYLLSATGGVIPSFPAVPVANPPLPLRLGDRGASVSFVQQQLRRLGYYTGPVNGIFDLPTRRSVLAFQQDYGISRTGVVGATTESYLINAVPTTPPVVATQFPSFVPAPQGRPIGGIAPAVQPVNPAIAQGRSLNPLVPTPLPQGRPSTAPVTPVVTPINPAIAQGRPLNPVIPAPTPQGRPFSVSPLRPIQPVTTYRSFVSVGDTGFEVRRIQQRLRSLNYYRGPVNGFFDRTTQDAVVRFQRANGISQTGVVGPTTRIYMFNSANSSDSTPTADASSTESTVTASVAPQTTQRTYTFNSVKSSELTSTVETSDSEPMIPVKAVTPVSPKTNSIPIQTTLVTPDASGLSSANIKELQQRLQVQGLYEGLINGVYDSQTETAVNKAYEVYGTSTNDVLFGGLQPQEN
ncbi:MAG: peptidoglycan-binding protein [Cyanobacteriota bacterium]|nr:peptidoglycan-binding protein [Cyanobacteriota bacterium]